MARQKEMGSSLVFMKGGLGQTNNADDADLPMAQDAQTPYISSLMLSWKEWHQRIQMRVARGGGRKKYTCIDGPPGWGRGEG